MVIKSAEVAQANIIPLKDIIEQHKRYKEALQEVRAIHNNPESNRYEHLSNCRCVKCIVNKALQNKGAR